VGLPLFLQLVVVREKIIAGLRSHIFNCFPEHAIVAKLEKTLFERIFGL
jgi:hypothetical protein